jgi:UDP-3-O-[3-hydroxymyristoyl] glucosamine N-acyltransferase
MNTHPTSTTPAAGWSTELPKILQPVTAEFGILELRNEAALSTVHQTGFAGTRREGVICLAMNRDYLAQARDNPCARAIIVPLPLADAQVSPDKALIVSGCAEELYLYLHAEQSRDSDGEVPDIDRQASVDASAVLRGRVRIEAGARVGPRVVISGPAIIRAGACIDAGAILGCDGLYAKTIRGRRMNMPHFGGVAIGSGAHIHAGAVIVRSAIRGEATRIGEGAHVGIMANVGHDAEIGDAATLSSHCVIAGRASVGARAWIGASATVSNAIRIGEGARVRLGAVVVRDVPAGASVSGNFAVDHDRTMRAYLKAAKP